MSCILIKNKFLYYAFIPVKVKPLGIVKKIEHTVEAANQIGYDAHYGFFDNRISGFFSFIKELIFSDADIIMVRFYDLFFPLLFPFFLYKRLCGVKLIVDIPTPRSAFIKEIDGDPRKLFVFFRKLYNYLSFTWVLWPFSRVVQYATESPWFEFGVKYKTLKQGNGFTIDKDLPLVDTTKKDNQLNLIAVAQLADWHGYDRLIKAMAIASEQDSSYQLSLTLIGDGPVLNNLKSLASKLGVEDKIKFTGWQTGSELSELFERSHVGVASLGLYRIGLFEASVLKVREYMARGLCVIGAGQDPDFEKDSPYRFLVENNDSVDGLVELLLSLKNTELPNSLDIRNFAENNLSFKVKIKNILDFND